MRIAVLSDIHANGAALEAVMNDIVEQNCEHVFCLGDLVLGGPQPVEIMDYVMEQNAWTIIQGNTDKMIALYNDEIKEHLREKFPVMANAMEDDVKYLSENHKAFLGNLPPVLSLEVEGVTVLLVHGSPRANNEDILPGMKIETVEEIIQGTTEKLILYGHTHLPAGYQTSKGQTVVNVGSVGRPMTENPRASYAIIDFNDGNFEVNHRFVKYDNFAASDAMNARTFEGADTLAQMLIAPMERHV